MPTTSQEIDLPTEQMPRYAPKAFPARLLYIKPSTAKAKVTQWRICDDIEKIN